MQKEEKEGVNANQIESLVLNCNKLAMEHLQNQNFTMSLHLLRRAKDLLKVPEKHPKLEAITLNNLGCFYKRTGKNSLALKYLQEALDVDSPDLSSASGTHLNICAIRSQMGQHDSALKHALEALTMLEESWKTHNEKSLLSSIIVASRYVGVEYEYIGLWSMAKDSYKKGLDLAESYLGSSNPLTQSLKNSYSLMCNHSQKEKPRKQSRARTRASTKNDLPPLAEGSLPKLKTATGVSRQQLNTNYESPVKVSSNRAKLMQSLNKLTEKLESKSKYFPIPPEKSKSRPRTYNNRRTPTALEKSRNRFSEAHQSFDGTRNESFEEKKPYSVEHKRLSSQSELKPPRSSMGQKSPKNFRELKEPKSSNAHRSFEDIKNESFEERKAYPAENPRLSSQSESKPPRSSMTRKSPKNSRELKQPKFHKEPKFYKEPKPPKSIPVFVKNACATQIQKTWKGYKQRKAFKQIKRELAQKKAQKAIKDLEELKKQVSQDQTKNLVRAYTPMKTRHSSFKKSNNSRRFSEPRLDSIPESKAETSDHVTLIQAQIRSFLARRKFLKLRKAAVCIQKNFRRWMIHELYQKILSAIICIQTYWRRYNSLKTN